jgi:hypothetical protein
VYNSTKKGRAGMAVNAPHKPRSDEKFKASIFSQRFTTMFVDEAHDMRTVSRLFVGGNQLAAVSNMVCLVTATPLYTKPSVSVVHGPHILAC